MLALGFTNHYLMHALMALSALHLYHQDTSRVDMFTRGTALQGIALRQVQPHLSQPTAEESLPLFCFSAMTTIYSLAEPAIHPRQASIDPIDTLLRFIKLGRGIMAVLLPQWEYLCTTSAGPLLNMPSYRIDMFPDVDKHFPTYPRLRQLVTSLESKSQQDACLDALEKLYTFFAAMQLETSRPFLTNFIQAWPVFLQQPFMNLLSERHPIALVIAAYYAVLLNMAYETWWIAGWSKWLLGGIQGSLDGEWTTYLEWPREIVFGSE